MNVRRGIKIHTDTMRKLLSKFGGTRKGWRKMKTWDSAGREIHYYEHQGVGKVGAKWEGTPDPF